MGKILYAHALLCTRSFMHTLFYAHALLCTCSFTRSLFYVHALLLARSFTRTLFYKNAILHASACYFAHTLFNAHAFLRACTAKYKVQFFFIQVLCGVTFSYLNSVDSHHPTVPQCTTFCIRPSHFRLFPAPHCGCICTCHALAQGNRTSKSSLFTVHEHLPHKKALFFYREFFGP